MSSQYFYGIKLRLFPTPEQERILWLSVRAKRFIWNWGLSKVKEKMEIREEWTPNSIRKEFNLYLKEHENELSWINEVSAKIKQQELEVLLTGIIRFYKKISGFPKYKNAKKDRASFPVRNDRITFRKNKHTVSIEKVGQVKYQNPNFDFQIQKTYIRPYCVYDNKYWYLCFAEKRNLKETKTTLNRIGIDLGVKNLATYSNTLEPTININKTKEIKRLKKKLKRLTRKFYRNAYLSKKENGEYIQTKNQIKLKNQIRLIYRKINNIRLNHIHQATAAVTKLLPEAIILEDLNVKGMLKNKHLSSQIAEQNFYEFRRQIEYKSERNSIKCIIADRFYPSSKTCSNCGYKIKKLSLKQRTFKCPECGLEIDRDLNAAINLEKYNNK